MSNYGITYVVPWDLKDAYARAVFRKDAEIQNGPFFDRVLYNTRDEIIDAIIPENQKLLKDILRSKDVPFFYVDKGKETKTVEEAAAHLGIFQKRVSKTVVAVDAKSANPNEVHIIKVTGDGRIQMNKGMSIYKKPGTKKYTDMTHIPSLKPAKERLIKKCTGMSPGWCGPFPLSEIYLETIEYIVFKEKYTRKWDLLDVGISPTKSVFIPGATIYEQLKNKFPEKVFMF